MCQPQTLLRILHVRGTCQGCERLSVQPSVCILLLARFLGPDRFVDMPACDVPKSNVGGSECGHRIRPTAQQAATEHVLPVSFDLKRVLPDKIFGVILDCSDDGDRRIGPLPGWSSPMPERPSSVDTFSHCSDAASVSIRVTLIRVPRVLCDPLCHACGKRQVGPTFERGSFVYRHGQRLFLDVIPVIFNAQARPVRYRYTAVFSN